MINKNKFTIRELRLLSGLTLEEASKLIGITREHLGRIETDQKSLLGVKLTTILTLANVYQTKLDNIIFFVKSRILCKIY